MTNEVIQTTYQNKAFLPDMGAVLAPGSRRAGPSTPALGGLLGDVAMLIERHNLELSGWNRKMSATLAHLKRAYAALGQAEEKIVSLESRVCILQQLATTDELTGLKNRRGFQEFFLNEIDQCRRSSGRSSLLVMIDVDNFKSVNDKHGHQAGDAALRLIARTLNTQIRKSDVAARISGDEFILLLTNTSKEKAVARAQAVAWQLNTLTLEWKGQFIPLHASIGLKEFDGRDQPDSVIAVADTRMYASKAERKNAATPSRANE